MAHLIQYYTIAEGLHQLWQAYRPTSFPGRYYCRGPDQWNLIEDHIEKNCTSSGELFGPSISQYVNVSGDPDQ